MHGILEIRRRGGVTPSTRIMDKPDLIDIGDDTIVPFSTNSDNPLMQSHMNDEKSRNINEKTDMETGDLYDCLTNEGTEIEIKGEPSTREGAETTPLQMAPTLGQIIGGFKYLASKTINEMDGTPGDRLRSAGQQSIPCTVNGQIFRVLRSFPIRTSQR
jgi:hypothetical protein